MGFSCGSAGKESAHNAGDLGSIPGLGGSPGKGKVVAESRETKEPLDESESEKVGLKLNIQKTKIMAPGPITSWEIDGQTVETVLDFIFGGSKITADVDCSHEIKRRLLLGRKL